MSAEWCERAARISADWFDAVCRGHGRVTGRVADLWLCSDPPRLFPNAVTLSPEPGVQHAAIADLLALPGSSGFSIKDSFNTLDLGRLGLHVQVEAQWLRLPKAAKLAKTARDVRWERVAAPEVLAEWERAREAAQGGETPAAPAAGEPVSERFFAPTLLEDGRHIFLAGYREGRIVAGAVVSRSDGAMGLSNLFAGEADATALRGSCVATVQDLADGLPVVGYERGDALLDLVAMGFSPTGSLRIWGR